MHSPGEPEKELSNEKALEEEVKRSALEATGEFCTTDNILPYICS